MLAPELKKKILEALIEESGYATLYDYLGEDDESGDAVYGFPGSAPVNWESFLLTLLYLKLEKDGEVLPFSNNLGIDESSYKYVPFASGDTDAEDAPKCTLIKKSLEAAGFVFPSEYNFIPEDSAWGYAHTIYSPPANKGYSINGDQVEDLNLWVFLRAVESNYDVWTDNFGMEAVLCIQYLKREYAHETGMEAKVFSDIAAMTEEEYQSSELTKEEAMQKLWESLECPFAFYCAYHPKWQAVRAVYHKELARANAAGEEPNYPFSLEQYQELDKRVTHVTRLALPDGSIGYFYEISDLDVIIDGAPARVQMIPDCNTEPDEGYGHNIFFVNPLFFVSPEIPLTYKELRDDIDKFYAQVFPDSAEQK